MATQPNPPSKKKQPVKLGKSPMTGHFVLKPVGKRGTSRTLSAKPDKQSNSPACR